MSVREINVVTHKETSRDYTAGELTAIALAAPTALDNWKRDIAEMDTHMPRTLEDTITAKGTNGYSQFVIDNYNAKILLRSEMPSG